MERGELKGPVAPRLSIVVTCKGRLAQLRQSLPRMVAQPDCECVVVDYDCPEGTAAWVGAEYPAVKCVTVADAPHFNIARARNLGARAANAEWLAFVDADVLLEAGFAAAVGGLLRRGRYFRPRPLARETMGCVVCHRGDFHAMGGYDEVLENYGGEDVDLYFRIERSGCVAASFDAALLRPLAHHDDLRTAYHEIADVDRSRLVNSVYNHVKYDLMREAGTPSLPEETRRRVYAEVRNALLDPRRDAASPAQVTLALPLRQDVPVPAGWEIRRRWTIEIAPAPARRRTP